MNKSQPLPLLPEFGGTLSSTTQTVTYTTDKIIAELQKGNPDKQKQNVNGYTEWPSKKASKFLPQLHQKWWRIFKMLSPLQEISN